MKRFCILALAAVMLCAALTGCAGTGVLDDSYSNVSTTRDGTVNGTNGERGYNADRRYNGTNGTSGYNGYGSYNDSSNDSGARGRVGSSGYNDRNNTGNFYSGSANTNAYTGTESGTGMVGGE